MRVKKGSADRAALFYSPAIAISLCKHFFAPEKRVDYTVVVAVAVHLKITRRRTGERKKKFIMHTIMARQGKTITAGIRPATGSVSDLSGPFIQRNIRLSSILSRYTNSV